MSSLRPKRFGDVPRGLANYHYEFLRDIKDALEILMGAVKSQNETAQIPGSQAVIYQDLIDLGLLETSLSGEVGVGLNPEESVMFAYFIS